MHRSCLALATLALALGAGGAVACGGSVQASDPVPSTSRLDDATAVPLTLEVSGGADADITYTPGPGQPPIQVSAATPWTKTLQVASVDDSLLPALTARTSSTSANATITCQIKVAGLLVEAETAKGPHAVATCSTNTETTPTP